MKKEDKFKCMSVYTDAMGDKSIIGEVYISMCSSGSNIFMMNAADEYNIIFIPIHLIKSFFIPDIFTPQSTRVISSPQSLSIRGLLEKADNLEYNIRTGFSLFSGVDESYRLDLIKAAQKDLAATVAELHNILNPTLIANESMVTLAEEVMK